MKIKISMIIGLVLCLTLVGQAEAKKKVVFLHGKPSHGYMCHEHRAGNILAAKRLNESGLVKKTGDGTLLIKCAKDIRPDLEAEAMYYHER